MLLTLVFAGVSALGMKSANLRAMDVESLRPRVHFTAQSGWINDPNGLVYFKGEYHLFFQHNPFGTEWGNMTWGHAISEDLIHWKQLPEALHPDELGTMFSGSAVVDSHHSLKLQQSSAEPMVCFYTAAGGTNEASKGKPFTQCLAYTSDGHEFTKLPENPVLPHVEGENRDPKVFWFDPEKHWVMALYLDQDRYGIFTSTDLRAWTKTDEIKLTGSGECPDLFELKSGDHHKWVFWGADGKYLLGSFNGRQFTAESEVLDSHHGNTGYAAQTYSDEPHGRRIQISWLRGSEFPGAPWNQQLGFPMELSLRSTPQGDRLRFQPIREIEHLWDHEQHSYENHIAANLPTKLESEDGVMDLDVTLKLPVHGLTTLNVNGTELAYDDSNHQLEALDQKIAITPDHGFVRLRILSDTASLEIFAEHGTKLIQLYALAKPHQLGISFSPDTTEVHAHLLKLAQ